MPGFSSRGGRFRGLPVFLLILLALPLPGRAAAAPTRIVLVTIHAAPGLSFGGGLARRPLARLPARPLHIPVSDSGVTLPFPAAAELLSGCGSDRTGVRDEATRGLPASTPSLAVALKALGFHTLALPGDPLMHSGSGLARGFERYASLAPALSDSARVDSALAWTGLAGRRFVWLEFSLGYPAEAWRRGDPLAADPEVVGELLRDVESSLDRLCAALGRDARAREVLIAIAEVGETGSAFSLAGAELRDLAPRDARLRDAAPTIVAAAGGSPREFEGRNLLAASGAANPVAPPDHPELRRSWGSGAACRPQLLQLLARSDLGSDSLLRLALDSLATRCADCPRVALEHAVALSRRGSEAIAAREFKSLIAAHPDYLEANLAYADHLLRFRRFELSRVTLAAIPPQSPLAALAAWRVAFAFAGDEDFPSAVGAARAAGKLAVVNPAALALEPRLETLGSLHDAVERDPDDAAARIAYARALGDLGLYDVAYPQLHSARALMPYSAEPDYWLATLLMAQGRPQHAAPTLERGLARDSTHRPSRLLLAEALMELGRRKEARAQLERALREGPGEPRDVFNLACLRATEGETSGALDALERAVEAGYADRESLEHDPDLATVRGDPRFAALLKRVGLNPTR